MNKNKEKIPGWFNKNYNSTTESPISCKKTPLFITQCFPNQVEFQ